MKLITFSQNVEKPWLWHVAPPLNTLPQIIAPDAPGVKHYKYNSVVPAEYIQTVAKQIRATNTSAEYRATGIALRVAQLKLDTLHEYQQGAVSAAVTSGHGRWLFNDDTGLGKAAQSLRAALALCGSSARLLVVCPAMVREAWRNEVIRWFSPDVSVGIIDTGPVRKLSKKQHIAREQAYNTQVAVISYNLLHHLLLREFDVIIWDEVHKLKNVETDYHKTAKKFASVQIQFGTSATAMPDKPVDFYGIGEILYPGRYGTEFEFKQYYADVFNNGFGWQYKGINEKHADDLRFRLSQCSSRTVRQEVAHLLPAIDISVAKLSKDFNAGVLEWARDAAECVSHFALLTHLRETAWCWQDILQRAGVQNVLCLTGDVSTVKRATALNILRGQREGVLIATMHSVGIGIDLTFCQRVLLIELDYTTEAIIQALGRFSRLCGKLPSHVTICVRNGREEMKAHTLSKKIAAINKAIKNSEISTKLCAALASGSTVDMKHFLTAIDAGEDDPYFENIKEE